MQGNEREWDGGRDLGHREEGNTRVPRSTLYLLAHVPTNPFMVNISSPLCICCASLWRGCVLNLNGVGAAEPAATRTVGV